MLLQCADDTPVVVLQFGGVTHIDFCQQYPYNLAVTASTRVSALRRRSWQ